MAPKRTIVVVVALVVGLAAALLIYVFLHNAQNNAFKNAQLEPAYIVAKPIPVGLSGSDAVNGGYLTQKKIPTEIRPATAITDLTVLQGDVAIAQFPPGQVLVGGMFVSPAKAAVSFAQQIPPGDVAVTISVDDVHDVASLAVPGNKVDLLINLNGTETFLLQNVPILAIGQSTGAAQSTTTPTTAPATSGLYTFAVRPSDAQRIAFAQQTGLGIYMVLVPPDNAALSQPPTNDNNVLTGPLASG